jgi:3-hydroxy-9,10-secoandrosta-1,3,5(10)-triene-9,17-dione monooxygenase
MAVVYVSEFGAAPAQTGLPAITTNAIALIETLRNRAEATESLRRLPDETMADLRASGVARVLQPARYGGAEAPLSGMVDVLIPIAAGCGSTAWCLAQYIMHNYLLARWPKAAQERIWGSRPDCLISGIIIPLLGTARRVGGGYVIDGNWPFVSGVHGSDWCVVSAFCDDTERYFIVRTDELQIEDTWHSIGLRGSGSTNVVATDLFVPEHMTLPVQLLRGTPHPGGAINPAPLYRAPVVMTFGILLSSAVLGMAEFMFEEYLAQCRNRSALMSGEPVASFATHHMKVGEASASLQAAEALLRADCAEIMDAVRADRELSDIERTGYRCNAAFAGNLAFSAARIIWDLIGARGVYAANPVARAFQDISVATRHITQNWDVNATEHGRARFRLPLTNASL